MLGSTLPSSRQTWGANGRAARRPAAPAAAPARCTRHAAAQRHVARARNGGSEAPEDSGGLRLFLDSGDVKQWRLFAATGALYGVTTNPLILERDGVPCTLEAAAALCKEAAALGMRELQLQAWGGTAAAMRETAEQLLDLGTHCPGVTLTIKLPCTLEGLSAARQLRECRRRVSITVTGVYAAHQTLLAAAVGADYVAPYLGRMGDAIGAEEALAEVSSMRAAMAAASTPASPPPRVLVASIRAASQMARLAALGCDTFTFSPAVMEELLGVPATLAAAADFEAAAARGGAGAAVRVA